MKVKPGDKFNRLTYVKPAGKVKHGSKGGFLLAGEYVCECGKHVVLPNHRVVNGYVKSCGCLQREKAYHKCYRHGFSKTKLYGVWDGIITRCENKRHHDYVHYGAKGVRMCEEWRRDFTKFRDWAIANGWKEGLTVDRIVGGTSWYSPDNCRIVDRKTQTSNRMVTLYVVYDGELSRLEPLSKRLDIGYRTAYNRFRGSLVIKRQDGTYAYRFDTDKHGHTYTGRPSLAGLNGEE